MQYTPPTRPLGLTRRRMALALPLLGAAAWLPSAAWASAIPAAVLRDTRALMGTRIDMVAEGADAATGLKMFQQALKLNPGSAIAKVEYANGMVMLEGDKRMKDAEQLYAEAAACEAADAMERLDVEMAKAELED